jgi:hypothetical protein
MHVRGRRLEGRYWQLCGGVVEYHGKNGSGNWPWGLASARHRRTSCVEFSDASSAAIFVDSISHRRPLGQLVSANSRSRLDEHLVTLCGVMVIVAV